MSSFISVKLKAKPRVSMVVFTYHKGELILAIFLHFCLFLFCLLVGCFFFHSFLAMFEPFTVKQPPLPHVDLSCIYLQPEGHWIPSTKFGPKPSQAPRGIWPATFQSCFHHNFHQLALGFELNIFFLLSVVPIFI